MENILERLYFGEIQPNCEIENTNPNIYKEISTFNEVSEKLLHRLSGDDKKLLHKLINTQANIEGNLTLDNFIHGFKLGVKIMAECL